MSPADKLLHGLAMDFLEDETNVNLPFSVAKNQKDLMRLGYLFQYANISLEQLPENSEIIDLCHSFPPCDSDY
eukprot:49747-Hanusia_phi.AAC.1